MRGRGGLGQPAVDGDSFLAGLAGLRVPPKVAEADGLVVERQSELGLELLRPGVAQLAVNGDGLFARSQGLLMPAELADSWTG